MNKTKLEWSEPEITDLCVKETQLGTKLADKPDGEPWQDGNKDWHIPFGKS